MAMAKKNHPLSHAGKQIEEALKNFETLVPRQTLPQKNGLNITPKTLRKIKKLVEELS